MLCANVLPKPIPGSSTIILFRNSRSDQQIPASKKASKSSITSAYDGESCMVAGRPKECMSFIARPKLRDNVQQFRINLQTGHVIHDGAPRSRLARATAALTVSTEITAPGHSARIPSSTGTTRRNSSSRETGSANGRVLSPPISRISAPWRNKSRPLVYKRR